MAIRTGLGKEATCNPSPARRTPSDPVVPVSCWHGVYFPTGYTVEVAEKARACVRELVDVGVPPADVQLATADKAMRHGACNRVKWPADVTGLVGPSGVPTGIPVCRGGRRDRVT